MRSSRVLGFPRPRRLARALQPTRVELLPPRAEDGQYRELPLSLRDVSYTGFTVEGPSGFPPGVLCRFRFTLPDAEQIVLAATARSTRPGGRPPHDQVTTHFAFATTQASSRHEVVDLVQRIGRLVDASRTSSQPAIA
jgi:hypothetical protein